MVLSAGKNHPLNTDDDLRLGSRNSDNSPSWEYTRPGDQNTLSHITPRAETIYCSMDKKSNPAIWNEY